jgi:hypothetical protein
MFFCKHFILPALAIASISNVYAIGDADLKRKQADGDE